MAKGKKSKRDGVVSKGIHCQKRQFWQKEARADYKGSIQEAINKLDAYRKFKNVMLTIENPDTHNTKERFIRVPATQVWGPAKR